MAGQKQTLDKALEKVQQETGARMFVLGEEHNVTENIKYIRNSLTALKAMGVTTLYIENPENIQPLIDKAISGHEKSQRDLRLAYERYWYYGGTEAAQERYDLIFEANKAGIKVRAVDTDTKSETPVLYNQFEDEPQGGQALTARLAIGDAIMSRNINRLDDGNMAIFLVGKAHTYHTDSEVHMETFGPEGGQSFPFFNSAHGGVDQRLASLGIQTASIDFMTVLSDDNDGVLRKNQDTNNDYEILLKAENPENEHRSYHRSTAYRASWEKLQYIYAASAEVHTIRGLDKVAGDHKNIARSFEGLVRMLDNPDFLAKPVDQQSATLQRAINRTNSQIKAAAQIIDDPSFYAAEDLEHNWLTSRDQNGNQLPSWNNMLRDNQYLHSEQARNLWIKPGMPLAGTESPTQTTARDLSRDAERDAAYQRFINAPNLKQGWGNAQNTESVPAPAQTPDMAPDGTPPSRRQVQTYDF